MAGLHSGHYISVCANCEVSVVVSTVVMLRRIAATLFHDRREGKPGVHGRALRYDIFGIGISRALEVGRRLEPTLSMPHVGIIDGNAVGEFPACGVRLTFWPSVQSRLNTRTRCPIPQLE